MILICHVINLTGQVLPVKAVAALGRARGIPVVVDGAHAMAHLCFRLDELAVDYYGTALHKWLFAPIGTGMLYVRRDKIAELWPMMAADSKLDGDIRKFEEIGTHPAANALGISQAVAFHLGLGPERKLARLVYLRDRWAKQLLALDRVRLHTSLKPGCSGGIATVQVTGIDSIDLAKHLWDRHRILVTPIVHQQFEGIRITPSVYTTLAEVDRITDAMAKVVREGLPPA
jgi:isopenicillin-N epimerase